MALSSLSSAIAGLQTNSQWLTTIANNIANVNTIAYKAQRMTFKDQIYQSLGSASGADELENIGGIDPEELGLGDVIGSIQTIMTQGTLQTTGNALDVAITGNGFFQVQQGNNTLYTRAGNFGQDDNGNVVTSSGAILQGWMGEFKDTATANAAASAEQTGSDNPLVQVISDQYEINNTTSTGNITIPSNLEMAAQMTTELNFAGNLDSNTPLNAACTGYNVVAGAPVPVALPAAPTALPSNYSPDAAPAAAEVVTIQQVNQGLSPGGGVAPAIPPPVPNCAYFHIGGVAGADMVTPDAQTTMTVYDSLGEKRSITFWFFQHGVNTDPAGAGAGAAARPVWDWYAFDTTNGSPDYTNCLGGTNIESQPINPYAAAGANPDIDYENVAAGALPVITIDPGDVSSCIWFNNDGSLASNGGNWQTIVAPDAAGGIGIQNAPTINLVQPPDAAQGLPNDGAISIQTITANFGNNNTWVMPANGVFLFVNEPEAPFNTAENTLGDRSGLNGDALGSFQNVNGVQTYVPDSTAYINSQNGFGAGLLNGLSVSSTGAVNGQFSNSQTIELAQIAMSTFANPEGLQQVGDSDYVPTADSGVARVTTAQNAGATLTGGALESSNVDLSTELTNMIVAQQSFDANARVITTDNDLLTTLSQIGNYQ